MNNLRSNPALAGAEIVMCSGGVEALQLLRQSVIDVVVTDPATPLREDLALVKELCATRPGLKTIVLAPATAPGNVVAAMREPVCVDPVHARAPQGRSCCNVVCASAASWAKRLVSVSRCMHLLVRRGTLIQTEGFRLLGPQHKYSFPRPTGA